MTVGLDDRIHQQEGTHMVTSQLSEGWRRSTRCETGTCVEARLDADGVALRDAAQPDGPVLRFTKESWSTFIAGVQAGELTGPAR
jgi:uncharacterized protein DUF397